MGIAIGPHIKRYKDIAMLLVKYGNSDLVKNAGLAEIVAEERNNNNGNNAKKNGRTYNVRQGSYEPGDQVGRTLDSLLERRHCRLSGSCDYLFRGSSIKWFCISGANCLL